MSNAAPAFVALVAPNTSEQMGGEGILAVQYFSELRRRGIACCLITHARVRKELAASHPDWPVEYVEDSRLQILLWKSVVLRNFLDVVFHWGTRPILQRLCDSHPSLVAHYVTPVSPVQPTFVPPGIRAVIGPKNGNVHYPPGLRGQEPLGYRARRMLRWISLRCVRALATPDARAAVVLVAGGERTRDSLRLAGYREQQFVDVLNAGVADSLADRPRLRHSGRNGRFVYWGRLVHHKGVHLALRALASTEPWIELDLIGRGDEEESLQALARELGIAERVHFRGWAPDHAALLASLGSYRGFVFPSLAEAHGIVVQEAMAIGLPVVALRWGGPSFLIDADTGVLVEPEDESRVVDGLARAMTRLAEDGDLADRLSEAGRSRAVADFLWSRVMDRWLRDYPVSPPAA
jgi:glycosyltransferase involved in cell wall biosynthesis